jgi:hypothetical protein
MEIEANYQNPECKIHASTPSDYLHLFPCWLFLKKMGAVFPPFSDNKEGKSTQKVDKPPSLG